MQHPEDQRSPIDAQRYRLGGHQRRFARRCLEQDDARPQHTPLSDYAEARTMKPSAGSLHTLKREKSHKLLDSHWRAIFLSMGLFLASLFVSLAAGELLLRALGHHG